MFCPLRLWLEISTCAGDDLYKCPIIAELLVPLVEMFFETDKCSVKGGAALLQNLKDASDIAFAMAPHLKSFKDSPLDFNVKGMEKLIMKGKHMKSIGGITVEDEENKEKNNNGRNMQNLQALQSLINPILSLLGINGDNQNPFGGSQNQQPNREQCKRPSPEFGGHEWDTKVNTKPPSPVFIDMLKSLNIDPMDIELDKPSKHNLMKLLFGVCG